MAGDNCTICDDGARLGPSRVYTKAGAHRVAAAANQGEMLDDEDQRFRFRAEPLDPERTRYAVAVLDAEGHRVGYI